MKKYTKRLLAFLLATVMVLSGLPMSAKEVKAADEVTFDFCAPTTGTSQDGENIDATLQSSVSYLTTSFAGSNWNINPTLTDVPFKDGSTSVYALAGTSSTYVATGAASIQKWSGSTIFAQVNAGKTITFDVQVPADGDYVVSLYYNARSNYSGGTVAINGTTLETVVPAGTGSGTTPATIELGEVQGLKAGTNTI